MKVLSLFLALAVLFVAVTSVSAEQEYQFQEFDGIPNINAPLTFNKFDSNLGTLQSITMLFTVNIYGGQLILDNDSDQPASGQWELGAAGTLISNDVSLTNSSLQPLFTTPLQVVTSGAFNLAANEGDGQSELSALTPDGATFIGQNGTDNVNGSIGTGAFTGYVWDNVNGTGTYDINANIVQWVNYGSIGGIEYSVTPVNADGKLEVWYNYATVPEPGSIAGLLSGLAALGFSLKRRVK